MNERQTAGRRAADEGFTLIEVLVALLVFAIVSTGIVAGSTTIIRMTDDNRARITAANLASQDLDVVRAIANPFAVTSTDGYTSIDGRQYHVIRSVSWINSSGADVSCNSNANLFFLRVNTRVTWAGQLGTTAAVQDDTILAPTNGTTNSETGAIGVSVLDINGAPVSGVTVTISLAPSSTGALPTTQPAATTAEGCTYVNGLKPGAYSIKIAKTGYIDPTQATAPTAPAVTVSAGATQSQPFTYSSAATFKTSYVGAPVSAAGTTPSNLPTDFIGNSTFSSTSSPSTSVARYPFSSGYTVFTGPTDKNGACASVDPAAWPAGIVNGVQLAAGTQTTVAAGPGGTAPVSIPMGMVRVRALAGKTYTATQALAQGLGNPGCTVTGSTLTWAAKSSGGWDDLLLPYGSWTISAAGAALTAANEQVMTNTSLPGVSFDGTVTLDPRKAKTP